LSRKVVTCRLTTMTRSGSKGNGDTTTKKVMCRVGGGEIPVVDPASEPELILRLILGWQDLQLYVLSRLDV
jgi:hypothetical protein